MSQRGAATKLILMCATVIEQLIPGKPYKSVIFIFCKLQIQFNQRKSDFVTMNEANCQVRRKCLEATLFLQQHCWPAIGHLSFLAKSSKIISFN